MSKPWAGIETPATDAYAALLGNWQGAHACELDRMRDMERRARHAEALLERSLGSRMVMFGEMSNGDMIRAHLAAARQEDGE